MTHPLTLNYRGAGTPAVIRMVNGLAQDTTGLGTLPAAVVDTANTVDQTIHSSNRVIQMGHRIFAAVGTDIFQKDGAGAFTSVQTLVFGAATHAPARPGLVPYMDPVSGPGWFHLYSGPGLVFHVLKYDFLTDAYSITNLGLTTSSGVASECANYVMIGEQFVGACTRGLLFYNPITDVISVTVSGEGNSSQGMTAAKGIAYVARGQTASDSEVLLSAVLGGVYADLANLPLTTNSDGFSSKEVAQNLIYELNGNIWVAAPRNDNAGYAANGWRLFEWDTVLSTLTEHTDTVLHPLLRMDGGLTVGGTGSNRDFAWRFYHYKVLESPFGAERTFIRAQLGSLNEGSVLFEHTGGGWALIGSSQWTGFIAPVHNPFGGSEFYWSSGELSAVMEAKVVPVSGGVRLDFRCFGDPTFADKIVRVYYSDAPGAPFTRAQLSNPVGGTGGASVLVNPGTATAELTVVDANGEGTPTTYSVVHDTLAQAIPASADVHWFIEVNIA